MYISIHRSRISGTSFCDALGKRASGTMSDPGPGFQWLKPWADVQQQLSQLAELATDPVSSAGSARRPLSTVVHSGFHAGGDREPRPAPHFVAHASRPRNASAGRQRAIALDASERFALGTFGNGTAGSADHEPAGIARALDRLRRSGVCGACASRGVRGSAGGAPRRVRRTARRADETMTRLALDPARVAAEMAEFSQRMTRAAQQFAGTRHARGRLHCPHGSLPHRQDRALALRIGHARGGIGAARHLLRARQPSLHDGSATGSLADPRPARARPRRLPGRLGISGCGRPAALARRLRQSLPRRLHRTRAKRAANAPAVNLLGRLPGRDDVVLPCGDASRTRAEPRDDGDAGRFPHRGKPAVEMGAQGRRRPAGGCARQRARRTAERRLRRR